MHALVAAHVKLPCITTRTLANHSVILCATLWTMHVLQAHCNALQAMRTTPSAPYAVHMIREELLCADEPHLAGSVIQQHHKD